MVSYVRILGQGILCEVRVETLGGGGGGEGIGEGEGEGHSNVSEVDEDSVKGGTTEWDNRRSGKRVDINGQN